MQTLRVCIDLHGFAPEVRTKLRFVAEHSSHLLTKRSFVRMAHPLSPSCKAELCTHGGAEICNGFARRSFALHLLTKRSFVRIRTFLQSEALYAKRCTYKLVRATEKVRYYKAEFCPHVQSFAFLQCTYLGFKKVCKQCNVISFVVATTPRSAL